DLRERPQPGRQRHIAHLGDEWLRQLLAAVERKSRTAGLESLRPAVRALSEASFTGRTHGGTFSVRDQNHELRLPAQGVGALRRATPAHQPESGAVLSPGHNLRW